MPGTEIATKPYGPDSSPDDIAALYQRISLIEPGIVLWREIPHQTVWHIDLLWQRQMELAGDREQFSLIVDVTEAKRPPADVRARLRELHAQQCPRIHIAMYVGKNFIMYAVARFVLRSLPVRSFSVHHDFDDALKVARRER